MKIIFDDGCQISLDEKLNNERFFLAINSRPGGYKKITVDRETWAQFSRPNSAPEPHEGGWEFEKHDIMMEIMTDAAEEAMKDADEEEEIQQLRDYEKRKGKLYPGDCYITKQGNMWARTSDNTAWLLQSGPRRKKNK